MHACTPPFFPPHLFSSLNPLPSHNSAAQRRLAHAVLSPHALEAAARGGAVPIGAAEAGMVLGLQGFLRRPPAPGELQQEEAEGVVDGARLRGDVEAVRCKKLLRELEALGALSHPPGPEGGAAGSAAGGGGSADSQLLSSLSDHLLASLSLSLSASGGSSSFAKEQVCPACGELLEEEVLAGSGVCEYCGHALALAGQGQEDEEVRGQQMKRTCIVDVCGFNLSFM